MRIRDWSSDGCSSDLGLQLLQHLRDAGDRLPAIMITGKSDVSMAVDAMKAGASDFIEKPVDPDELLAAVERAVELSKNTAKRTAWHEEAARRIADLPPRQREVLGLIFACPGLKQTAADLHLSHQTGSHPPPPLLYNKDTQSPPRLASLEHSKGS